MIYRASIKKEFLDFILVKADSINEASTKIRDKYPDHEIISIQLDLTGEILE